MYKYLISLLLIMSFSFVKPSEKKMTDKETEFMKKYEKVKAERDSLNDNLDKTTTCCGGTNICLCCLLCCVAFNSLNNPPSSNNYKLNECQINLQYCKKENDLHIDLISAYDREYGNFLKAKKKK